MGNTSLKISGGDMEDHTWGLGLSYNIALLLPGLLWRWEAHISFVAWLWCFYSPIHFSRIMRDLNSFMTDDILGLDSNVEQKKMRDDFKSTCFLVIYLRYCVLALAGALQRRVESTIY
jgi:hypothetical protein